VQEVGGEDVGMLVFWNASVEFVVLGLGYGVAAGVRCDSVLLVGDWCCCVAVVVGIGVFSQIFVAAV